MNTNIENNQLIKDVTSLLNEHTEVVSYDLFQSEYDGSNSRWDSEEATKFRAALTESNIVAEHVDNFGGEGEGEDYWSVYKFSRNGETVYVKFQGWYQSYNGSEFTEYSFVEPKEKVVTVYE